LRSLKKYPDTSDYADYRKITPILEISDFFSNLSLVEKEEKNE
jgi:hypothetical protein